MAFPPLRLTARMLWPTLVRITEPNLVLPMIRECRKLLPDKHVYVRRSYGDGKKPPRQSNVHS